MQISAGRKKLKADLPKRKEAAEKTMGGHTEKMSWLGLLCHFLLNTSPLILILFFIGHWKMTKSFSMTVLTGNEIK